MIDRIARHTRYDRAITARLSRDQVQQLIAIGRRQRRPVSELLRDAVDRLIAGEAQAAG